MTLSIELQAYSWSSYADALDLIGLPAVESAPYDEARVASWVNNTHSLGIKAYKLLPAGSPHQNSEDDPVALGNSYALAIKDELDGQLLKGAARLKAILEDALETREPLSSKRVP